jgi:hypothetical protein
MNRSLCRKQAHFAVASTVLVGSNFYDLQNRYPAHSPTLIHDGRGPWDWEHVARLYSSPFNEECGKSLSIEIAPWFYLLGWFSIFSRMKFLLEFCSDLRYPLLFGPSLVGHLSILLWLTISEDIKNFASLMNILIPCGDDWKWLQDDLVSVSFLLQLPAVFGIYTGRILVVVTRACS